MLRHCLVALTVGVCFTATAWSQQTESQNYKVVVPPSATVSAPTEVFIVHDETDDVQAFPVQQWTVRGNTLSGVTVTLSTLTPFVNASDNSQRRDVQLDLSIASSGGAASWSLNQSTDSTDYLSSDDVATVEATSNNVGRATLSLTVSFLTDSFGTFSTGDYYTTVVGTVSAN